MPHRQCRKSSAVFLCGIMCLFILQASIYPVLGKGSDIKGLLPYYVAKEETKSITNVNNSTLEDPASETTKLVIQRGETLWDLARRYQTTVDELVRLNQLKSPNNIREGQFMWVPNREIEVITPDPIIMDARVDAEVVTKTAAEVKTVENVPYTSWWVNVLRSIPFFAAVKKPSSKAFYLSDFHSSETDSKIQTFEIFVNKGTESIEKLPMTELTDVVDNRSKYEATKAVSTATENQIHSRGLGRFVTKEEVELLSRVIYGEARGEDFVGQVAVGAVVLNRLKDPRFPKTIKSIVYQSGAFTAVDDRQIHLDPDDQAYKAAEAALSGLDPTNGAIFYYNPRIATDQWIKSRPVIKRIGNHTFSI